MGISEPLKVMYKRRELLGTCEYFFLTKSVLKVLEDSEKVYTCIEDVGDVHTYMKGCGSVEGYERLQEGCEMWESDLEFSIIVFYILVHTRMF